MTITKFEHNKDEKTHFEKSSKKKSLHIKRKAPTLDSAKVIYSFESFDAFCNFCSFLQKSMYATGLQGFAQDSVLYEYNSNCYLIFTNIHLDTEISRFVCNAITEFAHYIDNSELFEKKITEYGKPIIKSQAIMTCIKHFCVK